MLDLSRLVCCLFVLAGCRDDAPLADIFSGDKGDADVTNVKMVEQLDGFWSVYVSIAHDDYPISHNYARHYTDGWNFVARGRTAPRPDGGSKFTKVTGPHPNTRPIGSSQTDLHLPNGETLFTVMAHCSLNGWGGDIVEIDMNQEKGPGFSVRTRSPSPFATKE